MRDVPGRYLSTANTAVKGPDIHGRISAGGFTREGESDRRDRWSWSALALRYLDPARCVPFGWVVTSWCSGAVVVDLVAGVLPSRKAGLMVCRWARAAAVVGILIAFGTVEMAPSVGAQAAGPGEARRLPCSQARTR